MIKQRGVFKLNLVYVRVSTQTKNESHRLFEVYNGIKSIVCDVDLGQEA